jgi:hypothetical protein
MLAKVEATAGAPAPIGGFRLKTLKNIHFSALRRPDFTRRLDISER